MLRISLQELLRLETSPAYFQEALEVLFHCLHPTSGVASPNFLGGGKFVDFRRMTLFSFGIPLLKAKNHYIC